ncbi:MAG: DNA-binding protein [Bacteroidota bacterium]
MRLIFTVAVVFVFITQGISQDATKFNNNHPNVHKILVKEVLQTTSYTYVHADEDGSMKWIAVPKMAANVGDTYYFQGGMEMGEFKSKELDRTFSSILFLNGLISPEIVEGGKTSLNVSAQKSEAAIVKVDDPIEPAEGGVSIAELYKNKEKFANKIVKVRGKVTKFNGKIMSRNWIHLQDAPGNQGKIDLTATTGEEAKVGDIITLEGVITLDKDFGAGYFYDIIMENARLVGQAE